MRKRGILLPVFSLPNEYGIGSFGEEAYRFVDFLAEAKQDYWQVLPLNPTSFGDSPYQSPSANAGNPYFIDLDLLRADGLLTKEESTMPVYIGSGMRCSAKHLRGLSARSYTMSLSLTMRIGFCLTRGL